MIKRAMMLLCTIALLISFILCIHAFSGNELIGCSAGSSCNAVVSSRWSFILGVIPVSALAFIIYSFFLTCLFFEGKTGDRNMENMLRIIIFIQCGAILGCAIWFTWLQMSMIGSYCPYCMTGHTVGSILSILTIFYFHLKKDKKHMTASLSAGLSAVVALACIQLLTTPRTAYERGFVHEELPVMSAEEYPVAGDGGASASVMLLFDYQCSHCQRIHGMLEEVAELLGGDVNFVLCPAPLSPECNPYVPDGAEDNFKGSCDLAKLSLALWFTDREAYKIFDTWLFEDIKRQWRPRSVEEAWKKAESLTGPDRLNEALMDIRVAHYLLSVSELFGRTSTEGHGALPRFIYKDRWVTPDADDPASLANLIEELIAE